MAKHPQNRAHRRLHRFRCINNRRKLQWVVYKENFIEDFYIDEIERAKALSHLWGVISKMGKTCSCFMCGNPRRYHGGSSWAALTIQERKELCRWKDEINSAFQAEQD